MDDIDFNQDQIDAMKPQMVFMDKYIGIMLGQMEQAKELVEQAIADLDDSDLEAAQDCVKQITKVFEEFTKITGGISGVRN